MSEKEISNAARTLSKLGASKGGKARANKLTPEERKIIARKGALARWEGGIPVADYEGEFNLGPTNIACAVLPGGKRIITQAALLTAIGRSRSPKAGTGVLSTVDNLPFFLQAKALQPFISNELRESTAPIFYKTKTGEKGVGYDALLLPKVAEVYLQLRDYMLKTQGKIPKMHEHIIVAADILIRGLANVGILALIDEATGYQEVRDRHALQEILDKYLRKEFAVWAKRFPDEFYQQIFRLRHWQWRGMQVNRPQIVARYTKDLVYARLAPGILTELEIRNPRDERDNRKALHHQFLTEDIGHPALAQHLYGIIGLMRIADEHGEVWVVWDRFMRMVDKAYPRRGDTLQLSLFQDDDFYSNVEVPISVAK